MSRSVRRKKKLVRLLRKAVDITYGPARRNRLGIEPDRSEDESRKLLKKLESLATQDPDNRFGICFTRLLIKILKTLRASSK